MSTAVRRRAPCHTIVCAALVAACVVEEEPVQNLPLTTAEYQNQLWQGTFEANINGVGVAQRKQVVRVQLPANKVRQWGINLAPVSSVGGAVIETGLGTPFPQSNGILSLRWGSLGFMEEVDISYPLNGGTILLTASTFEVWGRDNTTEPLRAPFYRVWAQEADVAAQSGRARYLNPVRHQNVSGLGNGASIDVFAPRRAVAYEILATLVTGDVPVNLLVNDQFFDGGGTLILLDAYRMGSGVATPNGSTVFPKTGIKALHPQQNSVFVANQSGVGNSVNLTILWYLDLG